MAHRRKLNRVVIDTMVVIRAARAFRQQTPEPKTAELQLVLTWRDDPEVFTWLFNQTIIDEYREVLRRLKVPRHAAGRFINLLAQGGDEITGHVAGCFRQTRRMIRFITAHWLVTPTTSSLTTCETFRRSLTENARVS